MNTHKIRGDEANTVETEQTVSPLAAILAFIVSFLLLQFVGAAILFTLGEGFASPSFELLIAVAPFSYMLLKHINIRRYIGATVNPKIIILGLAAGGMLFFINVFASGVLTAIFGVSQAIEEQNNTITNLAGSPLGLLSVLISLSLSGFCEEFTFRAFLQNSMNRRYSFAPALIVSSLAFGLTHFDPQVVHIVAAFIAALFLGYVYHRWNSYVVSALAHSTMNFIVFAILLLVR
jgi:membrane protease YdiL (CAAX protease family)